MSDVPQAAWFYTKEGERIGPMSFSDLKIRVSEGLIHPRTDLVWTVGMEAWKPAGEIEGLFERRVADSAVLPESKQLADTPVLDDLGEEDEEEKERERERLRNAEWPGIGRFLFYLFAVVLGAAPGFLVPFLTPYVKGYEQFLTAVPIVCGLLGLVLTVKRLHHVGMTGWWVLGSLVPLLNFWVGYRTGVCPAGYAYHRKLDVAGIFLAILYWLFLLSFIAAITALVLLFYGVIGDPEMKEQLLEAIRKVKEQAS